MAYNLKHSDTWKTHIWASVWRGHAPKDLKTALCQADLTAFYLCVNSTLHSQKILLLSSFCPPALFHVKPQCYNRRVVILSAWLPSLLGAITAYHAWHHPKSRVFFLFFSKPLGVAGVQAVISVYLHVMQTRPNAAGAHTPRALKRVLFQVANLCHVRVWWWCIWCEVDDGQLRTCNVCSHVSIRDVSWWDDDAVLNAGRCWKIWKAVKQRVHSSVRSLQWHTVHCMGRHVIYIYLTNMSCAVRELDASTHRPVARVEVEKITKRLRWRLQGFYSAVY